MRLRPLHAVVVGLVLLLLPSTPACTGELTPTGGGQGGGPDAALGPAEQVFRQTVEPLFSAARPKGTCAGCHIGSAPSGGAILGTSVAATYSALLAGALLATPAAQSKLISHGDHTGNAFCTGVDTPYAGCTANEVGAITAWIVLEIGAGRL